jgi:chromosome segregation ATPase
MVLLPARIAALEAELARLSEERGVEADSLARMLVRIAEVERARAAADARADVLAARMRELEAQSEEGRRELEVARAQVQSGTEAAESAALRTEVAERAAADGAAELERAGEELDAGRARLGQLETELARARREHGDEQASSRAAQSEADLRAARTIEEERSSAARARQQAAAAEVSLAAMRDTIARAANLVDEMDRREEISAAVRLRTLDQARRLLTGEARPARSLAPAEGKADAPTQDESRCEASVEAISSGEIELDLAD